MGLRRGRGRHVDSPRERELARWLQEVSSGDDSEPKPLRISASPFAIDTNAYLRAAAGAPSWSRRLLQIERLQVELYQAVDTAWREMRTGSQDSSEAQKATWPAYLGSLNLSRLNELIAKHNAYYPIEAGLRMQWPSGNWILPNGVRYPLESFSVEGLIRDFPREPDATKTDVPAERDGVTVSWQRS